MLLPVGFWRHDWRKIGYWTGDANNVLAIEWDVLRTCIKSVKDLRGKHMYSLSREW